MLKFVYDEKEYVLEKDKNVCFLNDEEKPVEGISLDDILNMIDNLEEIDFDTQYYKEACVECLDGVKEKQKFFAFLEYHFYIYTKDQKFIISDIQKEYEGQSFNKLLRANKVDDSYIVSLIICKNCGDTLIQIENLGIVSRDERRESKRVLDAAALTYVAAAATALLQLLRLITIANQRDD